MSEWWHWTDSQVRKCGWEWNLVDVLEHYQGQWGPWILDSWTSDTVCKLAPTSMALSLTTAPLIDNHFSVYLPGIYTRLFPSFWGTCYGLVQEIFTFNVALALMHSLILPSLFLIKQTDLFTLKCCPTTAMLIPCPFIQYVHFL